MRIYFNGSEWVQSHPLLVQHVVFKLTRLAQNLTKDRVQVASRLIVQLCKNDMMNIVALGRDYLRLLREVADASPILTTFYDTMVHQPTTLHKKFHGLPHFWDISTPTEFLVSSLTPDMEIKLCFILTQVPRPMANTFIERYRFRFCSNNSTVYADLIRYICRVIHPPNSILASNICQRWEAALIFMQGIKDVESLQSAKLALYYDWLAFTKEKGNVMDIEPGMLAMARPHRRQPGTTCSLIEFLHGMAYHFSASMAPRITMHIRIAMHTILEKGVVNDLEPIMTCPQQPSQVKDLLRDLFPLFVDAKQVPPIDQVLGMQPTVTATKKRDVRIVLAEYGIALSSSNMSESTELCREWLVLFLDQVNYFDLVKND